MLSQKRQETIDSLREVLDLTFDEMQTNMSQMMAMQSKIDSLEKTLTRRQQRHQLELKLAQVESKIEDLELKMSLAKYTTTTMAVRRNYERQSRSC